MLLKYFSGFISIVLHPVFVPEDLKLKWIALFFLLTAAFPLCILLFLKMLKVIDNIFLHSVKDREYAFMLIGFYNWLLCYVLRDMYARDIFKPAILLIMSMASILLISALLSRKFKISMHASGGGALVGFFVFLAYFLNGLYLFEIIVSIWLSAIIIFSRMVVQAHNNKEVYSGWVLGFLSNLIVFLLAYHFLIFKP